MLYMLLLCLQAKGLCGECRFNCCQGSCGEWCVEACRASCDCRSPSMTGCLDAICPQRRVCMKYIILAFSHYVFNMRKRNIYQDSFSTVWRLIENEVVFFQSIIHWCGEKTTYLSLIKSEIVFPLPRRNQQSWRKHALCKSVQSYTDSHINFSR